MKKHKKVYKEEIKEVSIDEAVEGFFKDFKSICYEYDFDDEKETISEYLLDKGYEFTNEEFNQISEKVLPKISEQKKGAIETLKRDIKNRLKSWHEDPDELDNDFFIAIQLKAEDVTDIVIDACREFLEDENRL